MTTRFTITVAPDAKNNLLVKGGPSMATITLKPSETRVIDAISGFAYTVEEGGPALPAGPVEPEATGKPQLQGV